MSICLPFHLVGQTREGCYQGSRRKLKGDEKLKAEGKADKLAGKLQNGAGGAKDKVRQEIKKAKD